LRNLAFLRRGHRSSNARFFIGASNGMTPTFSNSKERSNFKTIKMNLGLFGVQGKISVRACSALQPSPSPHLIESFFATAKAEFLDLWFPDHITAKDLQKNFGRLFKNQPANCRPSDFLSSVERSWSNSVRSNRKWKPSACKTNFKPASFIA
jgi:hypothetical protein